MQGGKVQASDEQIVGELAPALQQWLEAHERHGRSRAQRPASKRAKTQQQAQQKQRLQLALALRQEYTPSALKTQGRGALKGADKTRADLLVAALGRVWPEGFKLWIVQVRLRRTHGPKPPGQFMCMACAAAPQSVRSSHKPWCQVPARALEPGSRSVHPGKLDSAFQTSCCCTVDWHFMLSACRQRRG